MWLVDLERTAALLVGRCLGGMLQGAAASPEENHAAYWLKTPLFSNGLETDIPQLGTGRPARQTFYVVLCGSDCALPADWVISSLLEAALSGNEEQKPLDRPLRPDLSVLLDLALGSSKEPANSLWINMQDYAISKGLTHNQNQSRTRTGPDCCVSRCRLGQRVSEQRVPAGHRVQVLPGRAAEAQRPAGPRLRRGQVSRPLTFHPALLSSAADSAFPAGTSHPSLWPKFTAASTRSGTACWPARTWTSSRPGHHPERGGSVPVLSQFSPSLLPVYSQFSEK